MFVNSGQCEAKDVINILKPQMSEKETMVFDFLKIFLTECETTGSMIKLFAVLM